MGRIRLALDSPSGNEQHVFAPGETVRGKVYHTITATQEKIDSIDLIFRGKVQCIIYTSHSTQNGRRHTKHTEEYFLFHETRSLFRGPFTLQSQTQEWDFDFIFPTECTYQRGSNHSGVWAADGQGPLPPSFRFRNNGSLLDSDNRCFVEYGLKVKINQGSLTRSQEMDYGLSFSPVVTSLPQDPMMAESRFGHFAWKNKDLREEEHTIKQKLAHVFTNNPELWTPSISFDVFVHLPRVLASNLQQPIAFSIKYLSRGQTDPKNPTLKLMSLELGIKGETNWRVKQKLWSGDYTKQYSHQVGTISYTPGMTLPVTGEPVYPCADFGLSSFGSDHKRLIAGK